MGCRFHFCKFLQDHVLTLHEDKSPQQVLLTTVKSRTFLIRLFSTRILWFHVLSTSLLIRNRHTLLHGFEHLFLHKWRKRVDSVKLSLLELGTFQLCICDLSVNLWLLFHPLLIIQSIKQPLQLSLSSRVYSINHSVESYGSLLNCEKI